MKNVIPLLRIGFLSVALATALSLGGGTHRASAVSTGLWIAPSDVAVNSGASFSVQVRQHAEVTTSAAQTDVIFGRTRLQVTGVVRGPAYSGALFAFTSLAEANTATGVFSIGTVFWPSPPDPHPTVPAGDAVFATITMTAAAGVNAVTPLSLSETFLVDGAYNPIAPLVVTGGSIRIGDTDGDGCTDLQELGPNHNLGGQRDPSNGWDFFDVTGDKSIDTIDTLLIMAHFGHGPGDDALDNKLDRDVGGPGIWNTIASDTGVDLNDALVNMDSFGDDCSGPP